MSKSPEMMTQCELHCGAKVLVTWIDHAAARRGVELTLKDLEGRWVVRQVFATLPADEVRERSRDHARQREASDA